METSRRPGKAVLRHTANVLQEVEVEGWQCQMRYDITFTPEALKDLKALRGIDRAKVQEVVEVHLRHEPTKLSKSRIKRLRQLKHPQFRLRVDELRIFYDVIENQVEVLAIVTKSNSDEWLTQKGISE